MDAKLLDSTVAQTRQVAAWVADADPTITVPTCPGWTLNGDGQTIAWIADDADRAWLLRRTDAPLVLTHDRAEADVTIHGPAQELLEIVSRRRPLDDAEASIVVGDRDELVHLIANMNWIGAA